MQSAKANLFTRHDTFFGVCEGIGQDLGFNPNYLRLAFAVALLVVPSVVLATYLAAGAIVALTHWLVPLHRPAKMKAVAAPVGDNDDHAVELAQAA